MNIEAEVRSFLTEEKYHELLTFFAKEGEFLNEDYQETYYFDAKEDLRIQKNNFYSKIWMKKGKIHDEAREELEIQFPKEDFQKLEKLFTTLGFTVQIKWLRTRHTFLWKGITACVDFTKGYGYILELEKMTSEENKEITLQLLKQELAALSIPLTSKEDFEKKYVYYKEHWKELI